MPKLMMVISDSDCGNTVTGNSFDEFCIFDAETDKDVCLIGFQYDTDDQSMTIKIKSNKSFHDVEHSVHALAERALKTLRVRFNGSEDEDFEFFRDAFEIEKPLLSID
jgi:hypothetical protein